VNARRVAWGIWGLTLALLVVWPFLGAATGGLREELPFYGVVPVAVMAYATVGALITSRHPDNVIGLILAGIGLAFSLTLVAGDYATLSITRPDPLPADTWVAWLARLASAVWLAPVPLLFLLYPNGRVAGPRWRPVLWITLVTLSVLILLFALTPGPLTSFTTERNGELVNPLGLPFERRLVEDVTELAGLIAVGCAALAIVSLVLRFRRSSDMERQQIRWLGYVGAILVAVPLLGLLLALVRTLFGVDVDAEDDVVGVAAWITFFAVLLFGIPTACAIAILRYRLYQLDVIVKRTVVFGVLVVLLTSLGSVVGLVAAVSTSWSLEESSPPLLVLAGIAYGLLAVPLYRLAKRIADRVVFGGRSTPYEVLSRFSERVGATYSSEDVLPRMAQLLGEATRATTARVWLRVGRELHPAATWPADAADRPAIPITGEEIPSIEGEDAFEVKDRGEVLGALSVRMPPNDPLDPSKRKLALDLARQAGLVLRNVRLIEELRESRRRIVAAQDERAKKLERNIHDGAQQQLVALAVKQRLADSMIDRDPAKAHELLAEIQRETASALDDLRDLARGIYPPLLADQGLAAALEAQARKSAVSVEVLPDGIGRYRPETEAAVYFSCLEALQNVAKYAKASRATVRLAHANDSLSFEVSDDGRGFDPSAAERGSGLQGIADRLAALGGTFEVESGSGAGTTVRGWIPADALEEAPR
jgi:signal transduction histidine kinase